jgi:hypothetical protein
MNGRRRGATQQAGYTQGLRAASAIAVA